MCFVVCGRPLHKTPFAAQHSSSTSLRSMASSSVFVAAVFALLVAFAGAASCDAHPHRHHHRRHNGLRKMHFYMHDIMDLTPGATNVSTVLVANPTADRSNITNFGSVVVIDDPLTETPSLDSKLVGRARGTYMSDVVDPKAPFGLFLSFTCVFKNGTLSFQGQDDVLDKVREIAVIGGTGAFRFATGYGEIRTQDFKGLTANLDFTVYYRLPRD